MEFLYTKKNEWKGKPFVSSDDQATENSNFRACVKEQSNELMKRYQPPSPKITYYGAISSVSSSYNIAWSSGQSSKIEAEQLALSRCGLAGCSVALIVKGNECATYTISEDMIGFYLGDGYQEAENSARRFCQPGECTLGTVVCASCSDNYEKLREVYTSKQLKFGSLAIRDNNKLYWATDVSNRNAAKRLSMKRCKKNSCMHLLSFSGRTCVAVGLERFDRDTARLPIIGHGETRSNADFNFRSKCSRGHCELTTLKCASDPDVNWKEKIKI